MKTLTKSLFATVLTAILLTTSAMTTFAAKSTEITTSANGVNRIWVAGNVKLVLSQSDKEGVFVDENYSPGKTSVLRRGQTLYINSMERGQVTINISVKDLQRIEAAGESEVVTKGNFDIKYLQVFLSQSAKAKIRSTTLSVYTMVTDNAVLKMSGSSKEHTLIASNINNVKLDDYASLKTENLSSQLIANADQAIVAKAK